MPLLIEAGALRQRVTLSNVGEKKTGRGGFTPVPVVIARRIPAKVTPLSGAALIRAQQIDPRSEYEVMIRYRRDVDPRLVVTYHAREKDRTFEILNANDVDEGRQVLRLLCREAA